MNRLEELKTKYGVVETVEKKNTTNSAFDVTRTHKEDLMRLSKAPEAKQEESISDIYQGMAEIQIELAELAEEYGKLAVTFNNVVGKDSLYTLWDAVRLKTYEILNLKDSEKKLKLEAISRKGDGIERLAGKLAEVVEDAYQRAVEGREKGKAILVEVIDHRKNLEKKIIENLRGSFYSGADKEEADKEVKKLESELSDIDKTLEAYEKDAQDAKTAGDLTKVNQLTDEMSQVLDIKQGVMDGKLSADGVVSEIRRTILDQAEGLQSAKGALVAERVNYQAVNSLIDSMDELVIKYNHAKQDMIPVFIQQAKIAGLGMEAKDVKETLLKVANVSNKLMEANARLVTRIAAETYELLKTPIYDREKALVVEENIRGYRAELDRLKMEWAANQQTLIEKIEQPHYEQPQ